jgi:hypothetical protein
VAASCIEVGLLTSNAGLLALSATSDYAWSNSTLVVSGTLFNTSGPHNVVCIMTNIATHTDVRLAGHMADATHIECALNGSLPSGAYDVSVLFKLEGIAINRVNNSALVFSSICTCFSRLL